MDPIYRFSSRIRYSEVDSHARLTLESLLNYFQDSSIFHSEDRGVGLSYLYENRIAWVLSSWQIDILRYPSFGETVTIETIPYDLKGFMGMRNFAMYDQDEERIACANSIWTLIDTQTGRPCSIPPIMKEQYGLGEKLDMDYAPRKISIPSSLEPMEEIVVKPWHLDTNQHVNNGQFVRMALDLLPEKRTIQRLRAEYKKPALLQDVIIPHVVETKSTGTHSFLVSLQDSNASVYANIDLTFQIEEQHQRS